MILVTNRTFNLIYRQTWLLCYTTMKTSYLNIDTQTFGIPGSLVDTYFTEFSLSTQKMTYWEEDMGFQKLKVCIRCKGLCNTPRNSQTLLVDFAMSNQFCSNKTSLTCVPNMCTQNDHTFT